MPNDASKRLAEALRVESRVAAAGTRLTVDPSFNSRRTSSSPRAHVLQRRAAESPYRRPHTEAARAAATSPPHRFPFGFSPGKPSRRRRHNFPHRKRRVKLSASHLLLSIHSKKSANFSQQNLERGNASTFYADNVVSSHAPVPNPLKSSVKRRYPRRTRRPEVADALRPRGMAACECVAITPPREQRPVRGNPAARAAAGSRAEVRRGGGPGRRTRPRRATLARRARRRPPASPALR
jgi:hypothetical protein